MNPNFKHRGRKDLYFPCFLFVILSLFSTTIKIFAQAKSGNHGEVTPIILFVCEHGAARSTIAAAYFDKMAAERGLKYKAQFRGTDPDATLTPGTAKGLTADGFDVMGWKPLKVSPADVTGAAQVVTFDCTLPFESRLDKSIYQWNGIPPISSSYPIARDEIKKRVEALISELAKNKK